MAVQEAQSNRGNTKRPYGGYYQREVPPPDEELTRIGYGTPMGEYMRVRQLHTILPNEGRVGTVYHDGDKYRGRDRLDYTQARLKELKASYH